jgi:hypothetical protein
MATLETQNYISAPLRDRAKARWPRALVFCCVAFVLILFVIGCKSNAVNASDAGVDPAAANMAPAGSSSQPSQALAQNSSYTSQQQGESYEQAPEPNAAANDSYNNTISSDEAAGEQAVDESDQPPPPLPEYDQPPDPDPNYLWTPGYWAWGPDGYYWVPGVWCPPPYYGALWTPPYWGWYSGHYRYHHGYWGPHVGFYGGIDYGFGYIGVGYFGGYWRGHDFYYNRSVNNVGNVTNVYNREVIYNNVHYSARPSNRISYNGGNGGVNVAPRPTELAAMHETHTRPIPAQTQVREQAAGNRQQLYNQNHGRPAQTAFARPAGETGPPHIAEPPAAVQQVQQRDAALQQHNAPVENRPGAPTENRPGVPAGVHPTPIGESRPVAPAANIHPQEGQRTQPLTRPGAANHPEAPPSRPATGNPAAPQSRPEPALRPAPDSRPMQPSRPEPVMRPDPVNRPQYTPPSRPMPQSRPEPSAPMARPEAAPRPEPQPRPEAIQRPEPAPRAAPVAVPRPSPAPALRAAPAPAARPAPEAGHEDRPH